MEPTPRGTELIEVFRSAEFYMRKALESQEIFNPSRSARIFKLCSTDLAQLTVLPALLRHESDRPLGHRDFVPNLRPHAGAAGIG